MAETGFVFWGLFAAFGLIVTAYVVWMRWTERGGSEPDASTTDASEQEEGAAGAPGEPPAGEDGR